MKIKNTEIEIIKGDIKKLKVDFILNPEITNPDEFNVRKACGDGLKAGSARGAKIMAISALGCSGGFPLIGSAKIISQEVLKHCKFEKTTLEKIIICISDNETFGIFDNTVKGYITHIQDTLGDGPYVTVDIIIEIGGGIVIIERSNPPYGFALPGGFVDYGESLEDAAKREAKEETNCELQDLKQFHTYSVPGRDPRFQTVSTIFTAKGLGTPKSGDDAKALKVVAFQDLMKLDYAFDHKEILRAYLSARKKA